MRLKNFRRLGAVLCLVGVMFWMMAGLLMQVHAAGVSGSLTMICKTTDDIILSGMHWDIFKIGGRNAEGEYELQGDFAKYPVSLEDTSASALTYAAETLDNLATKDKLKPLYSANADEDGYLKFSNLGVGLYLVAGDYVKIEDTYYFPSAFLLEIAESNEDQSYDLIAYPKYIYKNGNEKETLTVKKIWANDETEVENRSAYITVEIYRDEVLYETITLDESNDWTYSWEADKPYDWRVYEVEIPENYYVLYRSNETQYVIVNTYNKYSSIEDSTNDSNSVVTDTIESTGDEQPDTPPRDEEQETTATDVTEPSTDASEKETSSTKETSTVTTTTTPQTTNPEKLPQTGQLWWPVPVLGLAGLVLIAIGFRLRTKE